MPLIKTQLNQMFIDSLLTVFNDFMWNDLNYISYMQVGFSDDEDFLKNTLIVNLMKALGYTNYDFDEERTINTGRYDKIIKDSNHHPLIVIETKNSKYSEFQSSDREQQLFPYMDDLNSPVGILTNGRLFEVWLVIGVIKTKCLEIDFLDIVKKYNKDISYLLEDDWSTLVKLKLLKKESLDFSKENLYRDPYLNISEESIFHLLLDTLQKVFDLIQLDIQNKFKHNSNILRNKIYPLRKASTPFSSEIKNRYREVLIFEQSFSAWLKTNGHGLYQSQSQQFVVETTYVLLNRILLIRICEDKKILTPKISDGGIKNFIELTKPNTNYNSLLTIAYDIMRGFYSHLYQQGIYDWYVPDNEVIYKILGYFNTFNFQHVNRDILGRLYENYLDPDEKKEFGQFYTSEQVVNFILDSIGYTEKDEIEGKLVFDPACGSGAFLVPIVNRLVTRYKNKGWEAEVILEKVQQLIFGFDINPFAVHITEINILFQLIDLIAKAKQINPNYYMKRLNIFTTDSLTETAIEDYHIDIMGEGLANYEEDNCIVAGIKSKSGKFENGFDVIVGNPPYGAHYSEDKKKQLKKLYPYTADYESSQFFIEFSLKILSKNGLLGFIVPNTISLNVNAHKFRLNLLNRTKSLSYIDASSIQLFKDPKVRNSIICCNNISKSDKLLPQVAVESNTKYGFSISSLPLEDYDSLKKNDSIWVKMFRQTPETKSIIYKIKADSIPLIEVLDVSQGLIPYDKYQGQSKEMIKNRVFHSNFKVDETYKKWLYGEDVKHYDVEWNGEEWISYGKWLGNPREQKFFTYPRILVREITNNGFINATYTEEELYNSPSIINITNKDSVSRSLKCVLGIVNSKLISFYLLHESPKARKGFFPKVLVRDIKNLPLKFNLNYESIILKLVLHIMNLTSLVKKRRSTLKSPTLICKHHNIQISHMSDTSGIIDSIKISNIVGNVKEIKIEGNSLKVCKNFKLVAKNPLIANCLFDFIQPHSLTLKGKNQNEVDKIIFIPKNFKECISYLSVKRKIQNNIATLLDSIKVAQHRLDKEIYELYGIDEKSQKLIDNYMNKVSQ